MRKVTALKLGAVANELAQHPEAMKRGVKAKSIKRRLKKLYNRGEL